MQNTSPGNAARLPPTDALLTFEAAARHLSFTRAGAERFVTQSAVSRQIKALEDQLGVALFRRRHRALELTDAGHQLHEACTDAFGRLREAIGRLRAQRERRVVTVTTTPGLASLWLIPRLARFLRAQPTLDVRLDTTFARRDLAREGIDLAIRYTTAAQAQGTPLFGEEVMPVCSPTLLASDRPLARPADLANHTLLRLASDAGGNAMLEFDPWLESMGVPGLQPAATLSFSQYDDVVRAAVHGQGVAMGRLPLVAELMRAGQLVAPFAGRMASPRGYFIVRAEGVVADAPVRDFERWLLEEAQCDTTAPPPERPAHRTGR